MAPGPAILRRDGDLAGDHNRRMGAAEHRRRLPVVSVETTSFAELPLGPETVAALAAEGIERPTPFQAAAIPVIARGRDLIGRAGPGSGAMVAYGAPLVDGLEGGAGAPACLVLCTGARQATELARSFARL